MTWILSASIVGIVVGVLKFIGAGSVVAGLFTVASITYSAFSGYKAYQQQKKAEGQFKKLSERNRSAFINYREPIPPRRILYGRVRVGGPLIFAHSPAKGKVHLIVALAAHQIQEIESVWVGQDQLVLDGSGNASGKYSGVVKVHQFLGVPGQDVGAKMITEGIGDPAGPILTTDKFDNIACLYVIITDWAKKIVGAEPEFSAVVKGKADIALDGGPTYTRGYTSNPILCTRDYIESIMEIPLGRVDFSQSEVDYCDALIALKAGGTEKRFTCNGIVLADQRHDEVLEDMANAFAGNVRFAAGKWRITAMPTDNTAFVVTEADMTKTYEYSYNRSARDLPNAIRGTYLDPERNWQATQFPLLDLSGSARRDELDLELPFTNTHTMAQRISKVFLYRARAQSSTRLTLGPRAFKTLPGEVITFSSERLGITKEMEVMDCALGFRHEEQEGREAVVIEVLLGLQEHDANAYTWDAATEEQDLSVGAVDLGGVNTKVPTDVLAPVTINQTTPDFEMTVAFSWKHPAITPEGTDLDDTRLEVTYELETTDGTNNFFNTYTIEFVDDAEGKTLGSADSQNINVDQNFEPAGSTYVAHTFVIKRARTVFSDATRSAWVDAP